MGNNCSSDLENKSNGTSQALQSTDKPTSTDISLLPIQEISVGKVFSSRDEVSYAVQIYHKDVNKLCRQHKNNDIIIHHICIEKSLYMRKHNKSLNESNHL